MENITMKHENHSSEETEDVNSQEVLEFGPNGQTVLPGEESVQQHRLDANLTEVGPRYRRGRGRSFFKHAPKDSDSCQVPGCKRSLKTLRDYYKRYKICGHHMEMNYLMVEGQKIRFCQQCGRFQLLSEFDGDKRSCRRRLTRHNVRRRKVGNQDNSRPQDNDPDTPDLSGSERSYQNAGDVLNNNQDDHSNFNDYVMARAMAAAVAEMKNTLQSQHQMSNMAHSTPFQGLSGNSHGQYPLVSVPSHVDAASMISNIIMQARQCQPQSAAHNSFDQGRHELQSHASAFTPFHGAQGQPMNALMNSTSLNPGSNPLALMGADMDKIKCLVEFLKGSITN